MKESAFITIGKTTSCCYRQAKGRKDPSTKSTTGRESTAEEVSDNKCFTVTNVKQVQVKKAGLDYIVCSIYVHVICLFGALAIP